MSLKIEQPNSAENFHKFFCRKLFHAVSVQAAVLVAATCQDMKTKMLVQTQSKVKNACGGVTCGNLKCPVGFTATEYPGHCCPYCVNPNIKIEDTVKEGAGGNIWRVLRQQQADTVASAASGAVGEAQGGGGGGAPP